MEEEKNRNYKICPYLGQRSDSGTALSYPSEFNYCYHAKPVAAIEVGHQEEFCLTSGYPNCEEYIKDPDAVVPAALLGSSRSRSRKRRGNIIWDWGRVLLVLGIIVSLVFIIRGKGFEQYIVTPTGNTGPTETNLESTSTFLPPTTTPVLTPVPTFTSIATFRPVLGLETPLGIGHKFLIHQIQEGESVDLIANQHGTTIAAILAINYRLPSPVKSGHSIVVPLNFSDTQGVPAFEVYKVTEEISVAFLASRLSVDLNEFKYYNALDDNFISEPGDWVLVPRTGLSTQTP